MHDRSGNGHPVFMHHSPSAILCSIRFMELNNDEIHRCPRHLILPEVGLGDQDKIKAPSA
jgi:hypothetical protein